MRIIPAIDILGGKCVRLSKGDFSTSRIYNEDPLEAAREFEDNGMKFLHLVDLDGAKNKAVVNHRILEKIAAGTRLVIDFGGGIRTNNDLRIVFESGASQVTAGSIALSTPSLVEEWIDIYGSERIILGADSKDGKIVYEGWAKGSEENCVEWIADFYKRGIRYAIATDVDKDGMLKGPATDLYKTILSGIKINLIASGGITTVDDVIEMAGIGCEGAIIGKAIYEGNIKLRELRDLC